MRNMLVVAAREYQAAVRTKTFIISLLIMPILMGGSALVQWLVKDLRDVKDKKFVVVDRSGRGLAEFIQSQANEKYNQKDIFDSEMSTKQVKPRFVVDIVPPSQDIKQQRFELSERIRKGELVGFVEIGKKVIDT